MDLDKLKVEITMQSIREHAEKLGIGILAHDYHRKVKDLNIRSYKEDFLIVKLFSYTDFFREKYNASSGACGDSNSLEHALNKCTKFEDRRKELETQIVEIDHM
jgi:hypothetical protein